MVYSLRCGPLYVKTPPHTHTESPAPPPLLLCCVYVGHAMDAIAARGDLEEVTDVFYYWEGGALDGKASSYRRSGAQHTQR
jgi:hypothetical protein